MKLEQVACQLYTLRDHLKTPADIRRSLKKVAQIGYPAVQVSGMGPILEAELMEIVNAEGLTICATHEPAKTILENPATVIERLQKLGCQHTAYPHPAGIDFSNHAAVKQWALDLERSAEALRAAGLTLSYHNHNNEFQKIGGQTILEYVFENTRSLQGEIDTYWVQAGGGDPVTWCERLKNRLPLLHLKDYAMTAANQPTHAEIGAGNLDWKRIIAAAEASGCLWYIVEQDTTPGDPFDSLRQSFDYIKANLI